MTKQPNRWLILAAAILTNLSLGTGYAWSVFQAALLETNASRGWELSQTSLAFSISFAMVPIGMIIFGPKVDAQGPKKFVFLGGILFGLGLFLTGFASSIPMLYLTYGVLLGLGIGSAYGAATSVAVKWFPDKKGLAGGLTAAGFGSGPIILSPIIKSLIASVGVYRTFNILGAILLIVICGASLVMKKAPAPKVAADQVVPTGKTYKEMLREGNFWLLWLIYTLGATGGMMIIGTASDIAKTYSLADPVVVVMLVGLANTFGRIFWGAVSDKIGRYYTVVAMFIVVAGGLFLLASNQTLGSIFGVIGVMMVALSFGGFLGAFPGITAENWGVQNAGSNYGWMFTAYGVAALFGPQLGTNIKAANNGDYTFAFFIVIAMAVVGMVLQLYFIKKLKKS
ncbi:L-lactate MFS transporter [Streptococcus minor]|uniref:L-lactate MFS transporter n=1 Tax=Streptococcus minor TaxID=229549 RepID=UPI000367F345|nr:OFA family MFS transporter [Streptococcus minor]